jgi:multisubunit Na+/H+ antiporter MnhE subunit
LLFGKLALDYFFLGGDLSPKALILGLMFAFIWSSAFTSARVIVSHAPPLGALSLRFFLSGIIALNHCYLAQTEFQTYKKPIAGNNYIWDLPKYNLSRSQLCSDAVD